MINPKHKLSGAIVFASVFVGSFMGAAITLVTSPKTIVGGLQDKLKGTIDVFEENMGDHVDTATIMVIENTTKVIAKTRNSLSKATSMFGLLKDTFLPMLKKK
ncbi:MAG: hypothetical protein L7F77_03555 [Candidatus Magnetominusculus sp. LBB02]|nr:hypothetical protein [Candidatus Magnetominusculus sp. LBB02]